VLNRRSLKTLSLVVLATVLFLAGSLVAAQTYTIRIAHEAPETHVVGVWSNDFKAAAEERSGGRIAVEIFPLGQLYESPADALQATIQGTIQLTVPSSGYMSTVLPQFQIFDLPMMFASQETLYAFSDGEIGQELLDQLGARRLAGLGYAYNVPLDLFSRIPIADLEDFRGQNIRVHTAVLEESVKALGGNATAMPAAEVYLAIERGVLDGALTTVAYAAPNRYHEITPYMTRASVSSIVYVPVINARFFDGLPDDLKAVVQEAADHATALNRDNLMAQEAGHIASLVDGGIEVIELTAEQRQRWQDALQSVYATFEGEIGRDLLDRALGSQ
jgi:C4-dicarboxylate-binding protein DctP